MSNTLSTVLSIGVVLCILILFLLRGRIKWIGALLEDPCITLRKRYERGEITKEEFEEKLERLETCGCKRSKRD